MKLIRKGDVWNWLTFEFKLAGSLRLTLFSSVSVFLKEKGRREVLRSAGAQNNSLLFNLDQDYWTHTDTDTHTPCLFMFHSQFELVAPFLMHSKWHSLFDYTMRQKFVCMHIYIYAWIESIFVSLFLSWIECRLTSSFEMHWYQWNLVSLIFA